MKMIHKLTDCVMISPLGGDNIRNTDALLFIMCMFINVGYLIFHSVTDVSVCWNLSNTIISATLKMLHF
jgi:hypothetical protein